MSVSRVVRYVCVYGLTLWGLVSDWEALDRLIALRFGFMGSWLDGHLWRVWGCDFVLLIGSGDISGFADMTTNIVKILLSGCYCCVNGVAGVMRDVCECGLVLWGLVSDCRESG